MRFSLSVEGAGETLQEEEATPLSPTRVPGLPFCFSACSWRSTARSLCPFHTPRACSFSASSQRSPASDPQQGHQSPRASVLPTSWLFVPQLSLSTCPADICSPLAPQPWTSSVSGSPENSTIQWSWKYLFPHCLNPSWGKGPPSKWLLPWFSSSALGYCLEHCFHLPSYAYVIVNSSL